jgi:hypothetical protein
MHEASSCSSATLAAWRSSSVEGAEQAHPAGQRLGTEQVVGLGHARRVHLQRGEAEKRGIAGIELEAELADLPDQEGEIRAVALAHRVVEAAPRVARPELEDAGRKRTLAREHGAVVGAPLLLLAGGAGRGLEGIGAEA